MPTSSSVQLYLFIYLGLDVPRSLWESPTRDGTLCPPSVEVWRPNHWATREGSSPSPQHSLEAKRLSENLST